MFSRKKKIRATCLRLIYCGLKILVEASNIATEVEHVDIKKHAMLAGISQINNARLSCEKF